MMDSSSPPTEALVDPVEDPFAFPDDAVATLMPFLPDVVFVEEAEVVERFLCKRCQLIALRPHVTNCHHLLCQTCFKKVSRMNCPVAGCPNKDVVYEGKNKAEDQKRLRRLRVRCLRHEYGCEEILSLQDLLDHRAKCEFREENLLPKLWVPKVDKYNEYIEQLQKDLNHLRKVVNTLKEELLQKNEEILRIQHNEKGFSSDIKLLQEEMKKLKNSRETDIKKLVSDVFVQQWNSQKDVLIKDVQDHIKNQIHQQRMEMIPEMSSILIRQLVKDEADMKTNIVDKVKIQNTEMITKHIKDLEKKIQILQEEISNSMKHAYSRESQKIDDQFKEVSNKIAMDHNSFKQEFDKKIDKHHEVVNSMKSQMNEHQNKMDDLFKEFVGQQENIAQETNLKIEECLRAMDHFKTQTKDSLNRKMESKDVKWIIGESCLGPSLSPEWVEWALEERRTEFVWKVPGVRSLVQRWKEEGKGHLQSEVFVTKEFGFKIRAKLELTSSFYWINMSIEFVKEEATPTRPSIYYHRRTFALMDQSEGNGPKRDIVHILEPGFGNEDAQRWMKGFHGIEWCSIPIKYFESGAPYVVNDALCLRILIEPLSVLWKSFASNDGTILWRIDDYSKKKKDSIEGVIYYLYSDSFYSNPRGFRMKIGLTFHSNGDLRMWVLFLRGEWDESLSERFPHKTTLTILDQSDSKRKKHLIRTEESDSTGGYWMGPNLPRSELERGPYLKDDSLLVKVVVEPKG